MNLLIVVGLPVLIFLNGILLFFLLPFDLTTRLVILISEVLAAAIVGFILWRRTGGH